MTDKKPGGRRPGSGRPPKRPEEKHVRLYFSVPPDVAEWLLALDRRSDWLTEVVRRNLDTQLNTNTPDRPDEGRDTGDGDGV